MSTSTPQPPERPSAGPGSPTGRFEPDSVSTFGIDAARWSGDHDLELRYSFRGGSADSGSPGAGHRFVERYHFDVPRHLIRPDGADDAVGRATALLHLTASMSYFKAALPPRIDVRSPLDPASVEDLLGALVEHGLAEMRLRAGVGDRSVRPELHIAGPDDQAVRGRGRGPHGGRGPGRGRGRERPDHPDAPVVVPIGGGKDSMVALDLVRRSGRSPVPLAVTTFGDPLASLDLGERDPIVRVRRQLDPALLELNRRGALNGHVPITAVISTVALVAACLIGAPEVVMANERDASIPTLVVDGRQVNHQYSKSWDFERLLAGVVDREVGAASVFSLLRPLSEATIFRRFATMPELAGRISSCNVVRTRGGGSAAGVRWCGDCPKCRYSFLGLAAHSPRDAVVAAFGGRDLLDEEAGIEPFLGLLELAGRPRPFECVGVPADARYLMHRCAEREEWAMSRVVRQLAPMLGEVHRPWIGGPNLVPETYWDALLALAADE